MARIQVEEYIREDGSSPYRKWFDGLTSQAAAKVATGVLRLEMGLVSNLKFFGGIGELRIDWGPGYRVYVAKDGDTLIVLFGGGTKRRQQVDIASAIRLHAEYKTRKAAQTKQREARPRRRER